MKSIFKIAFYLLFSFSLAHGDTGIGENSVAKVKLPEVFHHSNEGDTTLFVMPRKNDMDGPISMRITVLRDLESHKLPKDIIKELLLSSDEDKKLELIGEKLVSQSKSAFKDPAGIDWTLQHRSIYSEGILFTMTIGTVKGREAEPQCKELNDQVNAIITTLARKQSKPNKVEEANESSEAVVKTMIKGIELQKKKLPKMINSFIEWKDITLKEKIVYYQYFVDETKLNIPLKVALVELRKTGKKNILRTLKKHETIKSFLNAGYHFKYIYKDAAGKELHSFTINKSDLQTP